MSFEAIFMFAGVVILGIAGLKRYQSYKKLMTTTEKTPATIVGKGENRQTGKYYLVEFRTEGGLHRLPYPMPKKGEFFTLGQAVTLHYDPENLEKMLIEEDKAEMQGITFYISVAGMLTVFGLLLW